MAAKQKITTKTTTKRTRKTAPKSKKTNGSSKTTSRSRGGKSKRKCPTCGRTCIDVLGITSRIKQEFQNLDTPLRIAIMGCVVNGPGEAEEADVGICGGGNGTGLLIRKGFPPRKISGDLCEALINEVYSMLKE